MIVVDACVVISLLGGGEGASVEALADLLATGGAALAPSTVAELLSAPAGSESLAGWIAALRILPLSEGYWERAGRLRATLRRRGCKAALGDALLAQACIDAELPLLTNDRDFRVIATHSDLKLVAVAN